MLRTSVFLMTMMVMAASASAQGVEVSGTIGWTFSDGVNGNAVTVPGVGTFDRIDPKDAWAWGCAWASSPETIRRLASCTTSSPRSLEVGGTTTVKVGDIKLHNYQGYYAFNFGHEETGVRPYVLFGLGATQYGTVSVTATNAPREITGETRFSWTGAAGVKIYPTKALSVSASRGDGHPPTSGRTPSAGGAIPSGVATSSGTHSMPTNSSWPPGSAFDSK